MLNIKTAIKDKKKNIRIGFIEIPERYSIIKHINKIINAVPRSGCSNSRNKIINVIPITGSTADNNGLLESSFEI